MVDVLWGGKIVTMFTDVNVRGVLDEGPDPPEVLRVLEPPVSALFSASLQRFDPLELTETFGAPRGLT